jgi:hypothetical protein
MLGTITFVLILLFILVFALQMGKVATPKGFIWWIKLFVLYLALMIMAGILWLLSLPLYLGLRRLPPFAIIKPIHGALTQIMMWLFPIGMVVAIVCYLIFKALQPIVQGITLGIVDIANYTPFREFIETGVFDFVQNLLTLNFPGMWRSGLLILKRTPKYFREVFYDEIKTLTQLENRSETIAREKKAELDREKAARDAEIEACIKNNTVEITDLMTDIEKRFAKAENEKAKQQCMASSKMNTTSQLLKDSKAEERDIEACIQSKSINTATMTNPIEKNKATIENEKIKQECMLSAKKNSANALKNQGLSTYADTKKEYDASNQELKSRAQNVDTSSVQNDRLSNMSNQFDTQKSKIDSLGNQGKSTYADTKNDYNETNQELKTRTQNMNALSSF